MGSTSIHSSAAFGRIVHRTVILAVAGFLLSRLRRITFG
jgi:hypothetical protein